MSDWCRNLSDAAWAATCSIGRSRAAWLMEPERVWLHTRSLDHPSALPMYQRAGFVPYDQQIETVAVLD